MSAPCCYVAIWLHGRVVTQGDMAHAQDAEGAEEDMEEDEDDEEDGPGVELMVCNGQQPCIIEDSRTEDQLGLWAGFRKARNYTCAHGCTPKPPQLCHVLARRLRVVL